MVQPIATTAMGTLAYVIQLAQRGRLGNSFASAGGCKVVSTGQTLAGFGPMPTTKMPDVSESAAQVPASHDLETLREAARRCTACDLYEKATQTVFGEGPSGARLMIVGEVPGDKEDLAGRPFVGPAGQLLDDALAAAGLDRAQVYVTNAVKHFYFEERGKARIHKKPQARHLRACHGWLEAELDAVRPEVVVCLGATAAQALMGPKFRLLASRGQVLRTPLVAQIVATYHPSAILRMPDREQRHAARAAFMADVALAASLLALSRSSSV
jgi:uracil-DNA glycosylase